MGTGPRPTALAPVQNLSLCLRGQREAGKALVLRKTTSVTATHSLRVLPVYPSHSSCLSLSASLFPLHSVCLSFSLPLPLPHWALVLLPLCRDPWRSPMAWTCLIRARSTPSTCVRSAKCWVTTAAECNDRTPPPCPPPFCQPEKTPPPLCSSVLLRVSACGPAGVGMGGFGSCLVCRNGVTDVTAHKRPGLWDSLQVGLGSVWRGRG